MNTPHSEPLRMRLTPHDLVAEAPPHRSVRLDGDGRWCTYRQGPVFYRRTVDGEVVERRGSRAVPVDDAADVHARALGFATQLRALLERHPERIELHGEGTDVTGCSAHLDRALAWTPELYAAQGQLFRDTYPEPVPMLPPDRYRDLVILPAVGCPHGRCRFCSLYPGPFHLLEPDEFEQHLHRVQKLFGSALRSRDGVFLGSASALSIPQDRLLPILARVEHHLGRRGRAVAAFHDPDHAPRRSVGDYRELVAAGLAHATIGLESGHPPLRKHLGKSPDIKSITATVRRQREADMRSAVTLLVGAGGEAAAADHHRDTALAIEAMQLAQDDRVYLSPLEGSLPPERLEEELLRFRGELRSVTAARVAPYRIELFRYYA